MPLDEISRTDAPAEVLCWENGAIFVGDVRRVLREIPEKSVHCVVTSPPYFGLRSYGIGAESGEIGQEKTLQAYLNDMVSVFRELRRVLRDDGIFWLNIGDGYSRPPGKGQHKPGDSGKQNYIIERGGGKAANCCIPDGLQEKDPMMVPARLALAMQADGWILRSQIPWIKRSCMPESVKDRPTSAIEYVYMFTKSTDYFYDHVAVQQPGTMKPQNRFTDGRGPKSAGYAPHRQASGMTSCATRNFRNTDLFFTSLEKPHNLITDLDGQPLALDVNPYPFKGAHFATFPVKLVEPLITAATSEKGCCANCGTPWRRIAETKYKVHENWFGDKQDARHSRGSQGASYKEPIGIETLRWEPCCSCLNVEPLILAATSEKGCCPQCGSQIERISEKVPAAGRSAGNGFKRLERTHFGERGDETVWTPKADKTTGWKFTCTCFPPPDPVPCTVLDPFAGACTTLMVADRLGRNSIGIELNPDYAKMGLKRIQEDRAKRVKS
jgi:DNA modification methylase